MRSRFAETAVNGATPGIDRGKTGVPVVGADPDAADRLHCLDRTGGQEGDAPGSRTADRRTNHRNP